MSARQALTEVLGWDSGTFEVSFEAVERADRLEMGTAGILIDLTRELDERNAQRLS